MPGKLSEGPKTSGFFRKIGLVPEDEHRNIAGNFGKDTERVGITHHGIVYPGNRQPRTVVVHQKRVIAQDRDTHALQFDANAVGTSRSKGPRNWRCVT